MLIEPDRKCLYCNQDINGRLDKKFCNSYCKSAYHYSDSKDKAPSLFKTIDNHLKKNRIILKRHNKEGKATVRKQVLINLGFNPSYFTHYWKNSKGQVYLFCYEFGFLLLKDKGLDKYLLVHWQEYMANTEYLD